MNFKKTNLSKLTAPVLNSRGHGRHQAMSLLKADLQPVLADAWSVEKQIRSGRFQRSLSLLAGLSGVLSGLEVSYEHYKGSYSHRIMYTPVILSGALAVAGVWGFFDQRAARTVLRWVSALTMLDGVVGFFFHIRGIQRKPGQWRLPLTNLIMGPPLFAPLLFGVSAYLGLIASFLRLEGEPVTQTVRRRLPLKLPLERLFRGDEIGQGRYQEHLALATLLATFFSGFEALYSHYKNNFQYKAQWSPILITPLLMTAAAASIRSDKAARTWLPAMSLLAIADGAVGFFYHVRGVFRRPGGRKMKLYNLMYGPPIFAPLLFAACGVIGLLASLVRRERS